MAKATPPTMKLRTVHPGLEGVIEIERGDRMPFIPRHMIKVFADFQITRAFAVDVDVVGVSSSFARGNENNLHEPDGTYYVGPGNSPGYGVVNLGGRYALTRWLQLLAQINNLFDRSYYTGAQLGPLGFTDSETFIARPFPAIDGEFPVRHSTLLRSGCTDPGLDRYALHVLRDAGAEAPARESRW